MGGLSAYDADCDFLYAAVERLFTVAYGRQFSERPEREKEKKTGAINTYLLIHVLTSVFSSRLSHLLGRRFFYSKTNLRYSYVLTYVIADLPIFEFQHLSNVYF